MTIKINEVFNNELKELAHRKAHVESILNDNDNIMDQVQKELLKNGTLEDSGISKHLDNIANYLMESKDIDSGRKVNASFYRSEKDYRSNYEIGKMSYSNTDEVIDYYEKNLPNEYTDRVLEKEYIDRIFNPQNITESVLRNFILMGDNSSEEISEPLRRAMDTLYGQLWQLGSRSEREILSYFKQGLDIKEVAEIKNVTLRSVRKTLKNICRKGAEKVPFFSFRLLYK